MTYAKAPDNFKTAPAVFGLFTDGRLIVECADDWIELTKEETEELKALLMRPEEAEKVEEAEDQEGFPMQPIEKDAAGVIRFKENRIVSSLLEHSRKTGYGLNEIALGSFTREEREQLAQLIGYSVAGYGDLHYVSAKSVDKADEIAQKILDKEN